MPVTRPTRLQRTLGLTSLAGMALAGIGLAPIVGANSLETCAVPPAPVTYAQGYIDTTRAGGEPIVETHPDGTLLWGSHAGSTHFYSPTAVSPQTAAFAQEYVGQTYYYFSADGGTTWEYAPRVGPNADLTLAGVPASGFSDPEFAIDTAGNVFVSEINLANIAFAKSEDSGRTYQFQSLVDITLSDRQWMEADTEDVLWFVANTFAGGSLAAGEPVTGSLSNRLYKSVDGGRTFSKGQSMGGQQSSDIKVDQTDGRLYQLHKDSGRLEMRVFANARNEAPPSVTHQDFVIADKASFQSTIGPTMELDADGNLYVVWDDDGRNGRQAGVWYASSTTRGESWSTPQLLSDGQGTAQWPWVAVGDAGAVSVVWLQHETNIPGHDAESATGDWHVMAAQSLTGLGCDTSELAGFHVVQASDEAPHTGSMCASGTTCQAFAIDRRLGDYFSNEVTADGRSYIAIADTRSGGAIGLPLQILQTGGPRFTTGG